MNNNKGIDRPTDTQSNYGKFSVELHKLMSFLATINDKNFSEFSRPMLELQFTTLKTAEEAFNKIAADSAENLAKLPNDHPAWPQAKANADYTQTTAHELSKARQRIEQLLKTGSLGNGEVTQ